MRLEQTDGTIAPWGGEGDLGKVANYVWNTGTLTWEKQEPSAAGGGGAVTIADGADVTQGAIADAESAAGNGTVIALLKRIRTLLNGGLPALVSGRLPVDGSGVTQPISAAALPLPTGAATAANQLPNSHDVTIDNAAGASAVNIQDGGNSITVDGSISVSNFPAVQPVNDNGGSLTVDGSVTVSDGGGSLTVDGAVLTDMPAAARMTQASVSAAGAGDNTIVAGTGGQTIRVHKIFLVFASDVNVTIKDGAGTSLTGVITMKAGGSIVLDFDSEPWFVTSVGNAFVINLSAAVQMSGRVYYVKS